MTKSSKFDDAKNAIELKGTGNLATRSSEQILQPMSMEEFAEAIDAGGEMSSQFVEMKEGDSFRAFYMDRLDGFLEEAGGILKPVKRLIFELATKERRGLGIMFSLLEVTQLQQQIGEALPADGSVFVLVGKGGKKMTNKKHLMDQYQTVAFRNTRPPVRGTSPAALPAPEAES